MSDPRRTNIPLELREIPHWVAWKSIPSKDPGKKARKVPIDPNTGRPADTTNSASWGTFDEAMACATHDNLAGVGFVFTKELGFVGIDLDQCREPEKGELTADAQRIVNVLDSYTEVSPSGTGIHTIAKGCLPEGKRKGAGIEMYEEKRFFTFTGNIIPGHSKPIRECTNEISEIHGEFLGARKRSKAKSNRRRERLSDDEIIERFSSGGEGELFELLWRGDSSTWGSMDKRFPSQSEADLALCAKLAALTHGDSTRVDQLFRRSGLMREKWDELRGEKTYGAMTIDAAVECVETDDESEPSGRLGVDGMLAVLRTQYRAEFFHDQDRIPYVSFVDDGRRYSYRVKDHAFKSWLNRNYFLTTRKSLVANVLQQILLLVEGIAVHEGPTRRVFVRIGEENGKIYLDLADESHRVVEIDANGWRILTDSPVQFRRPKGLRPLPDPVRSGSVEQLRSVINVTDDDWPLVLAWLVTAFRESGPYGVLVLLGEQGSAKTTTANYLRNLVDPSTAGLRSTPRDERDLMIAARHSWVLAYDNISKIHPWLSDALCRISTGGALATRALFTDDEEEIFHALRPVLINGIEDFVERADLLDRSLVCNVPRIEPERRRTRHELDAAYATARPKILGALLDAVACGLRHSASINPATLPRMADLARFAIAAEPALGLKNGDFLRALELNHRRAIELAIEASPVAVAVREFMDDAKKKVELTAAELLTKLNKRVDFTDRPRDWPRSPKGIADALRRAAPSLRAIGLELEFYREPGDRRRRFIRISPKGASSVPIVPPASPTGGLNSPPDLLPQAIYEKELMADDISPAGKGGTHRDGRDDRFANFIERFRIARSSVSGSQSESPGTGNVLGPPRSGDVLEPSQSSQPSTAAASHFVRANCGTVGRDDGTPRDARMRPAGGAAPTSSRPDARRADHA